MHIFKANAVIFVLSASFSENAERKGYNITLATLSMQATEKRVGAASFMEAMNHRSISKQRVSVSQLLHTKWISDELRLLYAYTNTLTLSHTEPHE